MNAHVKKTFLGLTGLSLALPLASAASVTFRAIENILNEIAMFVVSAEALEGIPTADLWKPVFGAFTLVLAVAFAASAFVPVLKEHKGARTAIAVVLAFAAINFGGVGLIWSIGGIGAIIAAVVGVVLLLLTVTRSFKTGHTIAGSQLTQAKSDLAKSETDLANENKEKEKAESELNYMRKMLNKEGSDLAKADSDLAQINITGKNEIKDLENIRKIISSLASTRDEGEALKLKQAYNRQLGALSSIITPKEARIQDLNKLVYEIESVGRKDIAFDSNINNLTQNVLKWFNANRKSGAAVSLTATTGKKYQKAAQIAQMMQVFEGQKKKELATLNSQIKNAQGIEQQSVALIRQAIEDIHNNNYPPALTAINSCINDAKANQNNFQMVRRIIDDVKNRLNPQVNNIDKQLKDLLK
jgi:hypothetical protein